MASLESRKQFDGAISLPPSAADRDVQGFETIGDVVAFLGSLFRGK